MKLTKWMKSNIVSGITAKKREEKDAEIKKLRDEFMEKIFPRPSKKAEDLLDKIAIEHPAFATPLVRSVNVYVNSQGRIYGELATQTYAKSGTMENLRENDEDYEEGVRVYKQCEALERSHTELVGEVSSRIDCFNTDRQLLEGWPEIKQHVLNVVGENVKGGFQIALTYDDINKRLGL